MKIYDEKMWALFCVGWISSFPVLSTTAGPEFDTLSEGTKKLFEVEVLFIVVIRRSEAVRVLIVRWVMVN